MTFDIDTWPTVPAYVEIEGPSKDAIRQAVIELGLDWSRVEYHDAAWVLKEKYGIPVRELRWFTFDRVE